MTTPSFRSAATATNANTTVSVSGPAGVATNDYQLVVVQWTTAAEVVGSPPLGEWVLIADTSTGDGANTDRVQFYESTTAGNDPFSFTKTGSSRWIAARVAYANTAGRVGGFGTLQVTTSTTSHPTPLASPAVGEYLVVGGVVIEEDAGVTSFTPPNAWTERVDLHGGSAGDVPSCTVSDVAVANGTPTVGTFVSNIADASVTFSLVLGPANPRPPLAEYDFDFEVPSDSPYVRMGLRSDSDIVVEKFDAGTVDTRSQDVDAPMADARLFGVDRRTPPKWQFTCSTNATDAASALDLADAMAYLWDAEETRSVAGAVRALRYRMGGRDRRVYGRPRAFSVVPGKTMHSGKVGIVCDFDLAEPIYYADVATTQVLRVNSTTVSSGFGFPVSFPLVMRGTGISGSGQAVVGGNRPTWCTVTVFGPITDPVVQIGTLRWALRGSISAGMSVTFTGLPWDQGIVRSDGVYVPAMLDPRARLSQLKVKPGTYALTLTGYDPTSTAYAFVSWRDAHSSL